MSMVGRRGLLKTLGLAPLARSGKHKHRETPVGWTNQAFQLLIVNAQDGSFSGAFVYSPGPGSGNLIESIAATAGTDPYGNSYVGGIASYGAGDNTIIATLASAALGMGSQNPSTTIVGTSGGLRLTDSLTASAQPAVQLQSPQTTVAGPRAVVDAIGQNQSGSKTPQVVVAVASSSPPVAATSALLEVQGVQALTEQAAAPPTPSGAGAIYVDSTGHLTYKGPGGTVTILAGP